MINFCALSIHRCMFHKNCQVKNQKPKPRALHLCSPYDFYFVVTSLPYPVMTISSQNLYITNFCVKKTLPLAAFRPANPQDWDEVKTYASIMNPRFYTDLRRNSILWETFGADLDCSSRRSNKLNLVI